MQRQIVQELQRYRGGQPPEQQHVNSAHCKPPAAHTQAQICMTTRPETKQHAPLDCDALQPLCMSHTVSTVQPTPLNPCWQQPMGYNHPDTSIVHRVRGEELGQNHGDESTAWDTAAGSRPDPAPPHRTPEPPAPFLQTTTTRRSTHSTTTAAATGLRAQNDRHTGHCPGCQRPAAPSCSPLRAAILYDAWSAGACTSASGAWRGVIWSNSLHRPCCYGVLKLQKYCNKPKTQPNGAA